MEEAGGPWRKVLVVDDDSGHREIIIAALAGGGLEVLEAGDADTAVEIARQERPYLIFLDLQLERRRRDLSEGLRVVEALKRECPEVRVVAYTAWVLPHFRQQAIDAGCDEFLAKPVDLVRVREVTARYLDGIDAQSPPSASGQSGEQAGEAESTGDSGS